MPSASATAQKEAGGGDQRDDGDCPCLKDEGGQLMGEGRRQKASPARQTITTAGQTSCAMFARMQVSLVRLMLVPMPVLVLVTILLRAPS